MVKLIALDQLLYFFVGVKAKLAAKVDKVEGKGLSTSDFTAAEKTKLGGIATGANNYTHPTTAGNKHIPAGGAAGQILRWNADGTADWGADKDTTYTAATSAKDGLMPAADKAKLDGVEAGANKFVHPSYTAHAAGLYKVTVDGTGHVSAATAVAKADITGLGIPAQDTTYTAATSAKDGLMAKADKVKLDAVPAANTLATLNYVQQQISGAAHLKKAKVDALPPVASADANTIYMVPKSGSSGDSFDEYMVIDGAFELMGNSAITIETATNADIDTILNS